MRPRFPLGPIKVGKRGIVDTGIACMHGQEAWGRPIQSFSASHSSPKQNVSPPSLAFLADATYASSQIWRDRCG